MYWLVSRQRNEAGTFCAGGENGLGLGYDIFRELDNGEVLWIGCAASLEDARSQIMVLGSRRPSCYFVRSASTGEIIAKFDRKNFGEACA